MFAKCYMSRPLRAHYSRSCTSRWQRDTEIQERSSILMHVSQGENKYCRTGNRAERDSLSTGGTKHGHVSSSQREEISCKKAVFHLARRSQMLTPSSEVPGKLLHGWRQACTCCSRPRARGPLPRPHVLSPWLHFDISPPTTSKVLQFLSNRREGAPTAYLVLCHLPRGPQKNHLYHLLLSFFVLRMPSGAKEMQDSRKFQKNLISKPRWATDE